jgi:glutamate N-acetyltransferase/amino-acid N-acetyltransferase
MLAFFTTDAVLEASQAKSLLETAARRSFDRITVDGETSTNDMAVLMASGASGVRFPPDSMEEMVFFMALQAACSFLAQQIVRDGEGATKVCAVKVDAATDEAQAETVARAVANSPLFKCALFGEDANWGRVLSAAGASGAGLEPEKVSVRFGPHLVAEAGARADYAEDALSGYLKGQELEVTVSLGLGSASATVWATDLSYEYVKINAEYRT